ncbi:MAG: S8 family serine peptidase, partial [Anaerolineales bacterium]|nr:S8 family serine peptidase [Anaerolineales bacterium]
MNQFTTPHPINKSPLALSRHYGRFFLLSFLPTLLILTGLLHINRVAASTKAINAPTAASTRIHLKFHDDLPPSPSTLWLPLSLRNSVETMEPLFQLPQQQLTALRANGRVHSGQTLPNLNQWVEIKLTAGSNADAILKTLQALTIVEYAELAPIPAPLPVTPDFTGNQGYLLAATNGVDAIHSWNFPGGNGAGITIFDVEYSWNQNHEDLSKASGVALLLNVGDSTNDPFSNNNHGTAVLGEMIADNDDKGVTGISWGAGIGLAPANTTNRGYNPANAILLAVANGSPGDVILIEQQYWVCGAATDTSDYGPLEVLFSVFNAIQTATANGFVVVEAAGNGGMDLDDPACNGLFDRSSRDSGAIIVGAGRPPSSGLDRQRESFSSYGSRVDVQGWGSQVMTTGYGGYYKDPADDTNVNFWYTSSFNGTSSASPIVAGTVANLQGMAKHFGQPLSPAYVRELLVQTGSPQQGNVAQHIGPRPDLAQAIAPDLSLSQTVTPTDTLLPGQTITYTLTFTNHNVLTATNIILTDTISTYLLNAAVVSHTVTMTDTNAASGFVWQIGDLVYDTSGAIVITGQISTTLTADIVFANTAAIDTPNDPFPADNMAAPITTTVELP